MWCIALPACDESKIDVYQHQVSNELNQCVQIIVVFCFLMNLRDAMSTFVIIM